MDKYNIKRNSKPLTDDQINRHKDFNALLKNQQKLHRFKDARKPLYKNIGFMSLMILIGIILLMLVVDNSEEIQKSTTPQDSNTIQKKDTASTKRNTETRAPQ